MKDRHPRVSQDNGHGFGDAALGQVPFAPGYEKYLEGQITSSRADFNQAITWAVTGFAVVFSLLLPRNDAAGWDGAFVLILIVSHFATRAARGYINIIRWALILGRITKYHLAIASRVPNEDLEHLREDVVMSIAIYHIDWKSPVPRRSIVAKMLGEFGFGYLLLILVAYAGSVWVRNPSAVTPEAGVAAAGLSVLTLWEWGSFTFRSQYLESVQTNQESEFLVKGGRKAETFEDWLLRQGRIFAPDTQDATESD